MNNRFFVDFHVLQVVPPSCLNRDDTGSPKSAFYGGVQRARVSSQAWKHAMRKEFVETFDKESLSYRTKQVVKLIAQALSQKGCQEECEVQANNILNAGGVSTQNKSGKNETEALFFISDKTIQTLAETAMESPNLKTGKFSAEEKKTFASILKNDIGIEIALFGRMVASTPELNIDACSQVAHAISTHAVNTEYDYFTAIDDVAKEDSTGAGHLGTVEFNSSTLYRYATIAGHELKHQVGASAIEGIIQFMKAFVFSMPTGKQNTFANRTLPDLLMVNIRTNQPVSLVGAFEKPVLKGSEGYLLPSAKAFEKYCVRVNEEFAGSPGFSFVVGEEWEGLGQRMNFEKLEEQLRRTLETLLE